MWYGISLESLKAKLGFAGAVALIKPDRNAGKKKSGVREIVVAFKGNVNREIVAGCFSLHKLQNPVSC
jgi:hypothetical protein